MEKTFTVGSIVGEHICKIHGKNLKLCKICWKVFSDIDNFKHNIENHLKKEDSPEAATPIKIPVQTPKLYYGLSKELAEFGFNEEQQENLKSDTDDITS